ncbi:nucleotidyltransferase domain-containing protein [Salinibacter ruber]|uniref:nucleotidyltransferase domain-containing protein n=1 Tax=Salinibacter ruber TaxID=146919 RepID=UPI001F079A7A
MVYGSQARGEARPDSDVDLMIVLGGKVYPDEEAQRTSQLVIRLASEYGVALSPLHLSEENFERDRPLPRAARRALMRIRRPGSTRCTRNTSSPNAPRLRYLTGLT